MGLGATTHGHDTPTDRAHLLAVYASEEHLVRSVRDFLAPALQAGRAALLVATGDHRPQFTGALRAGAIDVDEARATGQLIELDAQDTLNRFLVDGRPDRDLFFEVVGTLCRQLRDEFGAVRVYGEMVAVLWDEGHIAGAIELEDHWNELGREVDFELLCGYPTSAFEAEGVAEAFRRVSDRHTALLPENVPVTSNDFVTMLVHDIRSPASVVSNFLSLLQDSWEGLEKEQIDDFLGRAIENAGRIERLVDDILTAARLDSHQFQFELAPVDMTELVGRVVASAASSAPMPIHAEIEPRLPQARADRARQMQILDNLLSNAIKFSPIDQPVVVSLGRRGDTLRVSVTDRGPGIPADKVHMLFKPFSRITAPDRKAVKGTGLGLYISKSLAEGQGGSISVSSDASTGTTFTVTVPVHP